jgi:VanZ family protein
LPAAAGELIADCGFQIGKFVGRFCETPFIYWRPPWRTPYNRMRHFLKNWLPLLVWVGVIFLDSTDLMSAEHTSRFIVPFLRWLKPDISSETLASIHFILRKCAHVGEYAVLGLLLLRAATLMTNYKRSIPIRYLSVLGVCLVVAATDEFHQTFVASRGASATDVMIDSVGSIVGLLIGAAFARRRSIKLGNATAAR